MLRLASASFLFALMIAGLSQAYGQPPAERGGCTLSAGGPTLSVPYAALLPPGAWELHWETLLATQQANGTQSQPLTHELVVLQATAGTAGSAGTAVQEAVAAAAGTAGLTGTAQAAGIAKSQDLTVGQAGTLQAAAGTAEGSAAAVEQRAADGKGGTAAGGSGGGGGSGIITCGGLLSSDWTLYLRKGSTDAAVFRQVLGEAGPGSVCRPRREGGRRPAIPPVAYLFSTRLSFPHTAGCPPQICVIARVCRQVILWMTSVAHHPTTGCLQVLHAALCPAHRLPPCPPCCILGK